MSTEAEAIPGVEIEISDANEELIDIDVADQPLRDVINVFSRMSKVNIIANDTIEGRVTVHLENVTWRAALESILDSVGLSLVEKRPGIFHVVSAADLAMEPVRVEIINLSYISATNLVPVVQRMLINSNATVMAMPAANVLVVKETASQLSEIRKAVEQVDKPREQVYIEAKFVELNDKAIEDLGINWQVLEGYTVTAGQLNRALTVNRRRVNQDAAGNFSIEQNANLNTSNSTSSRAGNRTFDGLLNDYAINNNVNNNTANSTSSRTRGDTVYNTSLSGKNFEELTVDPTTGAITLESVIPYDRTDIRSAVLSAEDFALTLSALKQMDGVSVVSNPKLLVSNGEVANIHIGRNEPNVVAVPQGDTGDRFAYRLDEQTPFIEIGVKLEVQPTVNTEDNITIRIIPELSRLLGEKTVGDANITFPITQIRRIETEFNLQSGKTVAIGGLTETNDEETIKKVPILGDIPIIGKYLFTHKHTEKEQDEVIIFVSVDMGNPSDLEMNDGIPSEGKLIHAHMRAAQVQKAKDAAEAIKEDEEIEKILSKYRTEPPAP
jgi:type IV pilus assembly protein PilQ